MTWTIRARPPTFAPMLAEYECPKHGRFELTVARDANGGPPGEVPCPTPHVLDDEWFAAIGRRTGMSRAEIEASCRDLVCDRASPWRISAPQLKRDSVPCFAAVRGGDTERRPGMLDTRPLAEGMPVKDWKAKQAEATRERRHHQLIAKGLKTKRVQV